MERQVDIMFFKKIRSRLVNFSQYLGNNCYLSSNDTRSSSYRKKVVVYTFAYGDFLDYYFNYSLPALMHDSNTESLIRSGYEVEFLLYTTDNKRLISEKYKQHPYFNKYKISIVEFSPGKYKTNRKMANIALLSVLKKVIDETAILFLAAPDMIISNRSLFNIVSASFGKNVCFASAHARVEMGILEKVKKCNVNGLDSATMVSLCFQFAHGKLKYADEELDENSTHNGMSYRKIADNVYTVHHSLPSPHLVFPTQEDYDFFLKAQDFNMWDREWMQMLIKTNRIKVSGSSDLFFAVELTPEVFSLEREVKKSQKYNDIAGVSFHNRVCRTFTSVWRSN